MSDAAQVWLPGPLDRHECDRVLSPVSVLDTERPARMAPGGPHPRGAVMIERSGDRCRVYRAEVPLLFPRERQRKRSLGVWQSPGNPA